MYFPCTCLCERQVFWNFREWWKLNNFTSIISPDWSKRKISWKVNASKWQKCTKFSGNKAMRENYNPWSIWQKLWRVLIYKLTNPKGFWAKVVFLTLILLVLRYSVPLFFLAKGQKCPIVSREVRSSLFCMPPFEILHIAP